jgi:sulfur-oxidizing protein SoxY
MSEHRRAFIKKILASSAYLFVHLLASKPASADWPEKQQAPDILNETLKSLFKDKKITDTDKIDIKIPKIAENGAVVPISISTKLPDVQSISILVEKNPIPLAAKFELAPELDAFVSARLKMAASSDVIVMVETNEAFYRAKEHVNVTIGGCGD